MDNYENIPEGELNFMMHFIQERLQMLQKFQEEQQQKQLQQGDG